MSLNLLEILLYLGRILYLEGNMSGIISNLDQAVIYFIRASVMAQKMLRHFHPNETTAVVVEDKISECPLVGIVYGARRLWLNPGRETTEPSDVVTTLHGFGVLQENWYDGKSYFALLGEWNYLESLTIYDQLSPKPELRKKLYEAVGLELTDNYYPDR